MKLLRQLVAQRKATIRPANQREIRNAEMVLGIRFDSTYREYLETFGIISYKAEEFYGLGVQADSYMNITNSAAELRETGMWPFHLLPICATGDGSYFAYDNKNHCVSFWNHANGKVVMYEENLELFIIERMFKQQE